MRQGSKEIELKLALKPADFSTLKAHRTFAELLNSPVRTEKLTSVYFDTDERDLRQHHLMLRVRRDGDKYLQTIKASSSNGVITRDEWEQSLSDAQPDLDAAAHTALGPLLSPKVRATLRPIFETRVERNYFHLADSTWRIEIAFDTEYRDAHTMTVQAATRLSDGRISIQVYSSAAVPPPPDGLDLAAYVPIDPGGYGRFFDRLAIRRTKVITPDLSPIVADLLLGGLPAVRLPQAAAMAT